MPSDDELLTAREAADRAGVTSGTIRLWERAGRLHPIQTGDRRTGPLYSAAELAQAMRRTALLQAASGVEAAMHHVDASAPVEAPEEGGAPRAAQDLSPEAMGATVELPGPRKRGGRPPAVLIRERLLKGSAWVLLGTAVATVLGTAANGLLFRVLGRDGFGVYSLGLSIATIGGTLSQLGMERAVVRLVASSLGTGMPGRARKTLRIVYASALIGSLFLAILLVLGVGKLLADHVFHSAALASVVVFLAGWLLVSAFQSLFAESFRAFQSFWLATLFNGLVFDVVAVAVFATLHLRHQHVSVANAILLTIGAITVSLVASAILLWRRYARLRGPGDIRLREVFDVAWPMLGFNMATFLVGTGVDLWVVGALGSRADVALYAAASKLVFYVATPFIIASQVVPPIIAELWAQGKKSQLERSLREVATLAGVPALLVLLLFVFAGRQVLGFVYGPGAREGAQVLAILASARLVAVVTGNSGVALQMTGFQRTMFSLTVVTGICSLAAEIVFGRLFGILGVAASTAVAQAMQNLLQLLFAKRRLGIWTHAELSLRPFVSMLKRTP
jgi:O-antigen/teichoic acid export membrane protein